MQGKIRRGALLVGACLAGLGACDARPHEAAPAAPEAGIPAAATEAGAEFEAETPQDAASPEDPAIAAAPDRPPSRAVPLTSVAEPDDDPPPEVEPVIIIGPRDGETLGEYRARADRLFNRLDMDGDGRLDREEIVAGVGQARLRNALDRADTDLDEHVTRQEFNDLVTRVYQRLDADGNGVITEAEFEAGDPLGMD